MGTAVNFFKGDSPGNVTITNVSTQIVPFNKKRKVLLLSNQGSRDVFVSIGSAAEVDKGLFMEKNGGTLKFDQLSMTNDAVFGITTAGSSVVLIQEGDNSNE